MVGLTTYIRCRDALKVSKGCGLQVAYLYVLYTRLPSNIVKYITTNKTEKNTKRSRNVKITVHRRMSDTKKSDR